jgi:hypothetical protein
MIGTSIIQNQVFRFDIPMNNLLGVQILQGCENAGCKESSLLLVELMFSAYMVPQISTSHQIHNQKKRIAILKRLKHIDYESVFQLGQQIALVHD